MDAARDPFEELTDLFLSDDPVADAKRDASPAMTPEAPAETSRGTFGRKSKISAR